MLFWIFLVCCSSRSTVIFLIVSKEIQKYDQKKFYFFSERKHFQIWYLRSTLKKNRKKNLQFFPYTKISNKKFRKIHYFANIKYKRNSRKYCEKKSFRQKKLDKKNFYQKKICRKKFVVKKNF